MNLIDRFLKYMNEISCTHPLAFRVYKRKSKNDQELYFCEKCSACQKIMELRMDVYNPTKKKVVTSVEYGGLMTPYLLRQLGAVTETGTIRYNI